MSFSPDQPRDEHGRWAGSGGGSIGDAVSRGVDWLASGEAQKALASVVTEDRVKTGIALGIKSALYHLAQFDDPMMGVVEDYVHLQVDQAAQHLQVTTGRARDMMRSAVARLIEARMAAVESRMAAI